MGVFVTEEIKKTKDWFWSAFGGTIIGMVGLLLGTILSNLSGQVATLRTEVSAIAEKVAASEGRKEIYKERFAETESSIKTMKEQLSQLEQTKEAYKEKFDTLNKMIDMLRDTEKELKTEIKTLNEKIPPPVVKPDPIPAEKAPDPK